MMSMEQTVKPERNAPSRPSWTPAEGDSRDGVPRVSHNRGVEAAFGNAIGHGGDRGSLVYSIGRGVDSLLRFEYPLALKMYPVNVKENEMAFIRAVFYNDSEAYNNSDATTPEEREGLCRRVPYLVLPLAVFTVDEIDRGIIMSQHDCSLKQFLFSRNNAVRVLEDYAVNERDEKSSFMSRIVFEPIYPTEVVAAIAFQLVLAVTALNEELPHEVGNIPCRGFTHNDIHLDNILLDRRLGRIALCDFELVSHISQQGEGLQLPALHRLPPYSRQSPHGLFCHTADSWALGLVVVSLLTGVDPLFADDRLMDDFGDGPLLQSHAVAEGTVPVLDWEGNIRRHVEGLLRRDDPSGQRVADAGPLMDLCGRCLVNRPGARPSIPLELLGAPVFSAFIESPREAERILREWVRGAACA